MVLFTSNNVTILQYVYSECSQTAAFGLDAQSGPFQHAYRNGRVLQHVGSVSDDMYVERRVF